MTWVEEIEQQLAGTIKKQPAPKPVVRKTVSVPTATLGPAVTPPAKKDDNVLLLLFAFLLLCVGITATYNYKTSQVAGMPPRVHHMPLPAPTPMPPVAKQTDRYDDLTLATTKIWERVKVNTDHINLLATIVNNNLAIDQKNLPRNYIYINGDWTINRMPDQLSLSKEDRDFLNKFLK